jgi:hypothetical protein
MIDATIPTANLVSLREQVEKLNKRATKLALAPLVLVVVETFKRVIKHELGFDSERSYTRVSLSGESPILVGWSLLAAVTRQDNGENLLRPVPGCEVPEHWRETDTRCEHCHMNRYRRDVFILRHEDGRETQVGRQCLGDFLGHISPEVLIANAEILWSAGDLMSEAEDDEWPQGHRSSDLGVTVIDYLTVTAAVIRAIGWLSKAKASEQGKNPTSGNVAEALWSHTAETKEWIERTGIYPIQERDKELATATLAWALSTEAKSDYLYNLGIACRQEYVNGQTVGIICSAIASYQAQIERDRQREARPVSQHVGEIGKRQSLNVRLLMNRQFEGSYGVTTLAKFEDESGNILIWRASGDPDWLHDLNGSFVPVKASIKAHDRYQGVAQTIITRVAQVSA